MKYPMDPLYAPRRRPPAIAAPGASRSGSPSSLRRSATERRFGAPVIDPGGKAARTHSAGPTPRLRRPVTTLTSWWTVAYDSHCANAGTSTGAAAAAAAANGAVVRDVVWTAETRTEEGEPRPWAAPTSWRAAASLEASHSGTTIDVRPQDSAAIPERCIEGRALR